MLLTIRFYSLANRCFRFTCADHHARQQQQHHHLQQRGRHLGHHHLHQEGALLLHPTCISRDLSGYKPSCAYCIILVCGGSFLFFVVSTLLVTKVQCVDAVTDFIKNFRLSSLAAANSGASKKRKGGSGSSMEEDEVDAAGDQPYYLYRECQLEHLLAAEGGKITNQGHSLFYSIPF